MEFLLELINIAANIFNEIVGIFYQSSIFILFGLLFSGIMHEFIPMKLITKNLGQNGIKGIYWATLLGAPLPLCSCSVLPAAATLRKKGASKPATASFIVSVPETGVDSVIVSYGLLGPVMAIYRPIAAITSAIAAGLACAFLTRDEKDEEPLTSEDEKKLAELTQHQHHHHDHGHDHDHHHHDHDRDDLSESKNIGLKEKSKGVFKYGFGPMLDDIAFWIVVGLIITGIMLALVPNNFFSFGDGFLASLLAMFVMVLISVPLYTCASMSTPVAAGLIVSGLSPGAALVYLLTGPATSIATINIVSKMLGYRVMWAYLSSIIIVAIFFGLTLDYFAADIVKADAIVALNSADNTFLVIAKTASAIIFFGLILISFSRKSYRAPMHDLKTQAGLATGFLKTHQKTLVNLAAAILFVALYPFYTLQVPPGSQGMIMRFGEVVDKDLSPGLYFRLPSPITETVVVESSNIRQISIDESLGNFTVSGQRVNSYENSNTYLTADENVLLIKSVITYEIDDIYNYHFYSEQNDDLLMDIARQVLVSESIQLPIDEVFTKERGNLESRFRDQLKSKVKDLGQGFNVLDARLVYVHAPNRVHDAFRDVASALEDLQRELFLADGNAISMLNEARGNSETIKANAKISAVNSLANARGQAAAFKPLADVHQIYPYLTERRLQLEAQEKWLVLPKLYINGLKNSQGLDLWLDPNAADVVRFKFKD
jgi:uncharacterized membrane protein YraQ (UPF0718 family)/regulator of protease activity HflC (stomatin/prohibitin superfamily)